MNKEYSGEIDTENFSDEDYDDFLDYLEDLDDLDDDDIYDDNDDDDSNEVEVYDVVPAVRKNNQLKGVNFGMRDNNGSSINLNGSGISLNISLDSIVDGFNSLSSSIKDAKYRSMKRKLKNEKAKKKRR